MEKFDLIVVYSAKLAFSAGSKRENVSTPFAKGSKNESYNIVYSYFLEACRRNKLSAAFATSADIVGPGKCKDYWLYQNRNWVRVNKVCYSKVIFDKFSPTNIRIKKNRKLLLSSAGVKPFNDPYIYGLFFDKQRTYNKLSAFSIPTATIKEKSTTGIKLALTKLNSRITKRHNKDDFSHEEIVVKDRFGAGGFDVYKFKIDKIKDILNQISKNPNKQFIIQKLVKFDKGFDYKSEKVSADIRLIHLDGKLIQTYIRVAKRGDFRCNEHQGGTLKYIPKSLVPDKVIETSKRVIKHLDRKSSLFALDFIISNSGAVYLLEGNTGPGLDWNLALKENEREAQKLINMVVKKLSKMAGKTKTAMHKPSVTISVNPPILVQPIIAPNFLTT